MPFLNKLVTIITTISPMLNCMGALAEYHTRFTQKLDIASAEFRTEEAEPTCTLPQRLSIVALLPYWTYVQPSYYSTAMAS